MARPSTWSSTRKKMASSSRLAHGWQHRQQQPQRQYQHWDWNSDLALHRPIGAGREWDNYILQRQQGHSSSTRRSSTTRCSASTWARQQDGRRKRIHLNLLPDILSQTITYILSINLLRIELRSHLAAALHPEPPGVAHQSQNNIRVALHHLDLQAPLRQHHRDLIDHLRGYLESYQTFRGRILASRDPDDIYNSLTTACQHYIEQLPPRHPTRIAGHQTQRETSTSSSTSSSSIASSTTAVHRHDLHQRLPKGGSSDHRCTTSTTTTSTKSCLQHYM